MRDDVRDRIRAAFSGARPAAPPSGAPAAPDPFLRDFLIRADRVVVPAMMEVGRAIEAHGRFFSVERVPERRNGRGVLIPTAVQMNVFRRHRTANYKNGAPHFDVVCDRAGRRVLFRRSLSPCLAGPEEVGDCALEALTRDRVQDGIAAMMDALARL